MLRTAIRLPRYCRKTHKRALELAKECLHACTPGFKGMIAAAGSTSISTGRSAFLSSMLKVEAATFSMATKLEFSKIGKAGIPGV